MMVNIEKKWLSLYGYTPKAEGSYFLGISAFRHRWEIGVTCDCYEEGVHMYRSKYYLYATRLNVEGLRRKHYEFPRRPRWSHVTD